MKKCLCVCAFMAALLLPSWVYALEVSFLTGSVVIERDGSKLTKVNVGTKILSNDIVKTGKKSLVNMTYTDGSEIRMTENSTVKIGRMAADSDSAPSTVIAGIVSAKFTKLAKGSELRRGVYTPTTVAAVRGTEFTVAVSETGDSRIELTEGSLDVHNPYGQVPLEAGHKVQASVAGDPTEDNEFAGTVADWKNIKDESLTTDPSGRGDQYKKYINDLSVRNAKNTEKITSLEKGVNGVKSKKTLDSTGKDLSTISPDVEDDYYLGDAAHEAISNITDRFAKDKTGMHDKFLQLKEESNKVREQQQRNFDALQAVRAAYKKAYDDIMSKHKDNKRKIKEGTSFDTVKPKIE